MWCVSSDLPKAWWGMCTRQQHPWLLDRMALHRAGHQPRRYSQVCNRGGAHNHKLKHRVLQEYCPTAISCSAVYQHGQKNRHANQPYSVALLINLAKHACRTAIVSGTVYQPGQRKHAKQPYPAAQATGSPRQAGQTAASCSTLYRPPKRACQTAEIPHLLGRNSVKQACQIATCTVLAHCRSSPLESAGRKNWAGEECVWMGLAARSGSGMRAGGWRGAGWW